MKTQSRKFRPLILILLIFSMPDTFGQSALLKGRVYSAGSFENIAHANVLIKNGEGLLVTSITTGYDGRYQTDSIEPGAYRLEINTREFGVHVINNVYLQEGKAANIDVALQQAEEPIASEEKTPETEDKKPTLLDILGGIFKTSLAGGF